MSKKAKTVNLSELLNILREVDGKRAQKISFVAVTDARLKKGGRAGVPANPYSGTVKVSRIKGMINFNYQNAVNNQLAREGKEKEFVASKRNYGVKSDEFNGCLVYGAGEPKLVVKVEDADKPKFVCGGKLIDKKRIEPWMPAYKPANKQIEAGLEQEINYKNYNISSIRSIKIGAQIYKVVH